MKTIIKSYSIILLIGLSITLPFFLGEGAKNMFLVVVMAVSPVFCLTYNKNSDVVNDLMFLFISLMLLICFVHYDTFRPTSYVYTLCFITSFLFLRENIKTRSFTIEFWISFLKGLIYLYGFVLIIQQLCVFWGFEPFLANAWRIDNPWRLPSLTPEPSHLARFVFFIMYTYLVLREYKIGHQYSWKELKKEKLIWFLYFWMMLTCQSATAFLLVFAFFLRYFNTKTMILYLIFGSIFLTVITFFLANNETFHRIVNLTPTLFMLDANKINAVDHSAAHRILPLFVFSDWVDLTKLNFWFGDGMDTGLNWCRRYMYVVSGDKNYEGDNTNIGGALTLCMDYGVLTVSILVMALFKIFKKIPDKCYVFCWIFINIFSSINTQLFWFSLLMVMVSSGYSWKRRDCKKINYYVTQQKL